MHRVGIQHGTVAALMDEGGWRECYAGDRAIRDHGVEAMVALEIVIALADEDLVITQPADDDVD
jgi:hypothetical protein